LEEELLTLREKIIKVLLESSDPLSAEEIADILGLKSNEHRRVYNELYHIAKSIRRKSKNRVMLYMIPPRCEACGYVFKDLDKPKKPSKCPRCISERISSPLFIIKEK